jgi:regulator of protease activity HflC (stomatin/prohibitin superfamily)
VEWFLATCAIVLIGILLIVFAKAIGGLAEFEEDRPSWTVAWRCVGAAAIAVAAVIMFFSISFTVDSKTQGVVTTHGRVHEETAKPGWHWKKPWDDVTQISTATDSKRYHGDTAIKVTLKGGNVAYVSGSTRSGVEPQRANKVFQDFRKYDDPTVEFRKQIVSDQLKAAMYRAFREVDLMAISGVAGAKPLDLETIEKEIMADLVERSKGTINADELLVTISGVTPSKKSQEYIEAAIDQENKTRTATEAVNTAIKEAEANAKLAKSLTPEILTNKCLDMVDRGVKGLPAGFNCNGEGTGVVIPAQ